MEPQIRGLVLVHAEPAVGSSGEGRSPVLGVAARLAESDAHNLHHGNRGPVQALCLTIVTNAVVLWNTVYMGDALDDLRRNADDGDKAAAHLSPALFDHINPYGRFFFDVDGERVRTTRRPLRRPTTTM